METKFQTSFIPKTNIDPISSSAPRRHMGFFTFLATLIFFISVIVAGGAFAWHRYLDNSMIRLKGDLEKNIKSFESQTIDEYVRLNNRIDAAKFLLGRHVAVSYIFDFLSEKTIKSLRFTDFKYDVGSDGVAMLSMNGEAKSYNAVAYQSEIFGKERAMKGALFSNLDLDTIGNVVFNFSTRIDPGFIYYTRKANTVKASDTGNIESLPSSNAAVPPARPAATGTSTSTTTPTGINSQPQR